MKWKKELAALDRYEANLVRIGKECSRAVESKYYGYRGDPANHIEFEAEIKRREATEKKRRKK